MESRNRTLVPRRRGPDIARATAYAVLATWAVVFFIFPPIAFQNAVDVTSRSIWLGTTLIAALIAFGGAVTRRDLKVEYFGASLTLVGAGFYFVSQVYYVVFPDQASTPGAPPADPTQRIALVFFALYAFTNALPRILEIREKRALTAAAQATKEATEALTHAQAAQPGAFPDVIREEGRSVRTATGSDPGPRASGDGR